MENPMRKVPKEQSFCQMGGFLHPACFLTPGLRGGLGRATPETGSRAPS